MKLYTTLTSPYGRVSIIVVHELGLADRVEIIPAKTRKTDSPYYAINVSGRVPYLVLTDDNAIEDSQEICAYLDSLVAEENAAHQLAFTWPVAGDTDWPARLLHRRAESLIDGLSVWLRESHRPQSDQSATIIEHEKQRALRVLGWWEQNIDHPLMTANINLTQIILYCALDLDVRMEDFRWRDDHPALAAFMGRLSKRAAIQAHTY